MEPTASDMLSDVVPSNGTGAQSAFDKVISQRQKQSVEQTETGLGESQSTFDTVIQQRKSPKTQLNSTFASVSGINPDDAAKAQQIGGAIGIGQDLTMRNAAEAKRIADQKRFEMYDLMESDPILGRQMMRREFASVAHDDIPQLTSVGALFKVAYSAATLSPFPKDVALEISQQYEGTQYQTEEALIYHWMNNNNLEEKDLSEETRQRLKFLEQNAPPPINTYLFGGLSYTAGQARSMAPEVAKYAIAGGATYGALGLVGGPLAPATVAGGVLIGTGLGATLGIGVITSRIEGGMIYKDLLRSGVPKDVARTLASIGGTANGLVEIGTLGLATAPFKPLLKKVIGEQIIKRGIKEIAKPTAIGAVKTAAKYYAMAEGGELGQELSQETVSIIVEEIARSYAPGEYESKLATPEGRLELGKRYFSVAEQTLKATALLGGFGPMLNLAVDAKKIRVSANTKQFLTDLSKNGQPSKTRGRSPKEYANFVAALAKGTAAETMYVDAEEMTNVLNQSGLTAQQIDNALPGVREQLSKATSGGDIQIPTAQFAANIVGTKLEAPLMEHARLAPDAISAKQAIAQQETMQQNMKDAQVEMAVQEKVNAQFVSEAKEIEKVVNDQLIAAGRPPTEAAFAAKLVQARAVTGAARDGITPAQWVAQHPVPTFQSQRQATQQAPAQGSFEQASRANLGLGEQAAFNEASQRPEIVTWAKEKFGDRTAPDGSSVWQNFTEWFGDSKVVDAEGKPMVVYHGTQNEKMNEFSKTRPAYFSADKQLADEFADRSFWGETPIEGEVPTTISAYLSMKNPLVITTEKEYESEMMDKASVGHLLNRGYDGIIYNPDDGGSSYFLTVSPTQIKSAIANVGTFGQQDPNILRQEAIEKSATPKGFAKIAAAAGIKANTKAAMGSKTKTGREFKLGIQKRVLDAAATAGIDLSVYTPEVRQYLISMAVSDAIAALDAGGSSAKAVGWYNEKVTKALRKIGLIHPEILTDPQAKFVFIWALATTSNGIKVDKNFRLAEEAYRYFKKSGKLPTNIGMGTSSAAINAGLQLFNKLSEKYSFEELEAFFTTKHTVKEVDAFTGRGVSGENQTTIVYGSAALGAKVGNGFFSNLYGHFEQLTIDRWLMRTWGRWSGNLVEYSPKNVAIKQKQLKSLIALLSKSDSAKLSDIIGVNINTSSANTIATAIKKASSKEAIRIKIIQIASGEKLNKIVGILGEPKANAKRIGIGDEIRKTGNSLWGYLDGQKEQPEGAVERGRMRDVFAAALAVIQQRFPDLTMADLQAVLWYPEKNLYDTAKADEGVESTYEEDKAPDFDNAAQKLALELGITKEQLDEVTAQVDRDIIAERGSRRPGRSLDSGGYDGGVGSSQVLSQSAVPATFYSALGVEVGKSTTKSASADSWKQQIKGLIAKGVVKEKEVYWSGLDNWLDLQEGKITKEQVQAFLDAGGVKVQTETMGGRISSSEAAEIIKLSLQFGQVFDADAQWALEGWKTGYPANLKRQHEALLNEKLEESGDSRRVEDFLSQESETKYEDYQVGGGTNYREVLVTLPINMQRENEAKEFRLKQLSDKINALELELKSITKNIQRRHEIPELRRQQRNAQIQLDMVYKEPLEKGTRTAFTSSHWDQKNVLVHLRMNDRVDADGKKVLFVEEVQSDWGQAGREKGFKPSDPQEIEERKNKLLFEFEAAKLIFKEKDKDFSEQYERLYNQFGPDFGDGKAFETAKKNDAEYVRTLAAVDLAALAKSEAEDKYNAINHGIPSAPFVESTSGWLELGLKQILLEAVNGGYDRVAFVDGDQSVERYRQALTNVVDEVEITRNDDGTYTYSAIKNGTPVQGEQSVKANRINEVFGKSGSKQLLEQADANPEEIHTIASGDIEIGGEGMRNFYDTIVPQALSKILKKLGGDKIGEVNIGKSVGKQINAKEVADEAVKLMNGDTDPDQFADNLGIDEGDIPNLWIDKLLESTDAGMSKAQVRRIATNFAAKVKDRFAGGKSMTQQGFTVTPALAEQVSQGLPLFQAATGGARGEYDPIKNLIGIGKNADYSTVAHELAHWYVVDLFRTASDPTASEASRADADILLNWFGIAGDNVDQRLANWNAMTLDEQRRHHEAVAYNWELYLHTGKAPSVELQGVFDRFRRWLTRAYKSIRDDLNEIYRQQFGTDLPFLTDEVRGVFDRMLASEEQIARREAIDNFKGMYQTQEESGMNDATWAAYQAELAEAHEMAVTDLTKATVKQMEWLSGARKGILKAMQAAHNALRRSVQGEESVKMDNEPVRKAERFFKTGRMVDTDGKEIEVLVGNKLNKVDVEGMYPTSTTGLAPAVDLTKLRGMTMEGGLAPDLAAEMFGFSSGDELIRALAELKPFKDELKERTDARMLDEHGGMNTEAEKEEAVNKALANEVRARIVTIENRYLTKVKTPVAVIMQGAKELARTILGRMAIKDIKPRNYVAAEARVAKDKHTAAKAMQSPETAGKSAYTRSFNEQIAAGVEESAAASEALVKSVEAIKRAQAKIDAHKKQYGDVDPAIVAAKASHQQVIQNQLAKEGYKILEEVEKQVTLFKRFFKDDKKIAETRNMDLVNAARSILAFYGLGKHDKLPGAYLKQIQEYNPGLFETISAMVNEAQVGTPDYRLLTFEEFQSMQETVDALWQLAKRENQIKIEGKMVSLGQATEKLEKRLDVIGVPTTIAGETQAVTSKDRAVRHINSMKAILRRVEHWADSTDGAGNVGGPFTKYIWRPISQALDAYRIDRNNYVKRYVELLKQVSLPAGKIAAPELNYTFGAGNGGIGIAELLGAIMHSGNISNLEKLLIGRKWATVSEDGTMDTSRWDAFVARVSNDGTLTKEHFDFIQAVWDLNEELKPMVQKAHYDIEGYYFKEVEATPFTNRFGTYRGGYVPAKTDPFIVRDAQRQAKMSELESDFRAAMPSTGAGFTKSRVKYNKALSLDIRLMAKHIDDVIRYSHVQPAVKDVLRILKKSSFADKLTQMDAMAIDEMLTPWLNRAARQITSESGRWKPIDTFWRTVRSRTGISVMIGNITNALQQVTGLFMSSLKVKPAIIGNALYAYFSSPRQSAQEVAALSPFMSNRMKNQIFDLQDQMNELILNPNKFQKIQKWSSHHGYFLQSAFQNMVDIVTWTGAYNQHLAESGVGVSDADAQREAVNRADAAVRLTQGTMNPEGLAAFEVGTPFYKTFIQFTGYFNMLANLNTDEYVKIFRDLGWRGNEGKLAYTFLMGFAAQAIISDAIVKTMRGGWEDDDDDGYLDVFMDWIFGSMGRSAIAMVPFGSTGMTAVSQIVMPIIKGKAGTGYDDRIQSSPSISALTSSTIGVGRAILDVVSEDKEVTGQDVKDVMTLISLTTGIPVTLLGRPVSYLVDVNRGKVEPTSTVDLMRGLITGTATKESKKR